MPHVFREVTTGGAIAEREWYVAKSIATTHIDSCLVIVADVPLKKKRFAIHLSFADETDFFSDADAATVVELMRHEGADMSTVHLYGDHETWSGGGFAAGQTLIKLLGSPQSERLHAHTIGEIPDH